MHVKAGQLAVSRTTMRVAWYRFRTAFGSRRGGYLSIILLIALTGGVAMGALAAARRTQSSFPAYLAGTNPSDLAAITAVLNPLVGSDVGYDPHILHAIAHLPHVKDAQSASGLNVLPLGPSNAPENVPTFPAAAGNGLGSDDGFGFDQDRLTVVAGRLPDPRRAGDVAVLTSVAKATGLHLGEHVLMGVYTNAQTQLSKFGTAGVAPYRKIEVTVTALVVSAHNLVEDDVDNSVSLAYFTPSRAGSPPPS